MHSIARVSVQFVYFHLYVLCLVYDEYDNKAIIIIIIIRLECQTSTGMLQVGKVRILNFMYAQ